MLSIKSSIGSVALLLLFTGVVGCGISNKHGDIVLKDFVVGNVQEVVTCDGCEKIEDVNCKCVHLVLDEEYPGTKLIENAEKMLGKKGFRRDSNTFKWEEQNVVIDGYRACRRMMTGEWYRGEKKVRVQMFFELRLDKNKKCPDENEYRTRNARAGFYIN
jgi:hypothetical protein